MNHFCDILICELETPVKYCLVTCGAQAKEIKQKQQSSQSFFLILGPIHKSLQLAIFENAINLTESKSVIAEM